MSRVPSRTIALAALIPLCDDHQRRAAHHHANTTQPRTASLRTSPYTAVIVTTIDALPAAALVEAERAATRRARRPVRRVDVAAVYVSRRSLHRLAAGYA